MLAPGIANATIAAAKAANVKAVRRFMIPPMVGARIDLERIRPGLSMVCRCVRLTNQALVVNDAAAAL